MIQNTYESFMLLPLYYDTCTVVMHNWARSTESWVDVLTDITFIQFEMSIACMFEIIELMA